MEQDIKTFKKQLVFPSTLYTNVSNKTLKIKAL